MSLGISYNVDTDFTLYFDTEADLLAFTDGVTLGTIGQGADTGNSYIWNGVSWKALGGATVYSGNGAPSSALGSNGDIYIDFNTGDLYEKVSGAWVIQGDISPSIPADTWLYGSTTATTAQGNASNFYSEYPINAVFQKSNTATAITGTNRVAESTTSTPLAFQTVSAVSAISGRLYLAHVFVTSTSGTAGSTLSVTGGPNWSLVKTVSVGGGGVNPWLRLSVYSAMSTSSIAGATLGIANSDGGACAIHVNEFQGVDQTGTDGSGAIVQSGSNSTLSDNGLTITLSPLSDSVNNAVVASYVHHWADATTPPGGFTEFADTTTGLSGTGDGYESAWLTAGSVTPRATWTNFVRAAGIAVELKANITGSSWGRLVPGLQIYRNNFDVVSTSATTNLISQSIPAGLLETTSGIRVTVEAQYLNNSGAGRGITLGVTFGGTSMWSDVSGAAAIGASATRRSFFWVFFLRNEASASSQRLAGIVQLGAATAGSVSGIGNLGGALTFNTTMSGTAAVNTASGQTLAVTFAHSANAATIELIGGITVEVLP